MGWSCDIRVRRMGCDMIIIYDCKTITQVAAQDQVFSVLASLWEQLLDLNVHWTVDTLH